MNLIVIFVGLICQITNGSDHFAALVRDSNHRAEIIVPVGAEVVTGAKRFKFLFNDSQGDHYSIADHELTIHDGSGQPKLMPDFLSFVIHLTDVTDGNALPSNIKDSKTGPATTIVDLKGGELDVDTLWSAHVDAGKVKQDCIARSTQYTLALSAGTVDITSEENPPRLLRIKAGTKIQIANSVINATAGEHFEMYKGFVDKATKIDLPAADFKKLCKNTKHKKIKPTKTASVECSDTQFP